MNDRQTVQLAIKGILVFAIVGLIIVGGLVWRGAAPEGHIVALVALIAGPMGGVVTMLTQTRHIAGEVPEQATGKADDPVHTEEGK